VVSYDPDWPGDFAVLARRIQDALGPAAAVTDRYLQDIAPGEVIAAAHAREWTEPGRR
jgi:hypothetical protein